MNETQILTIVLSTAPTMLTVLVGILINNARLGDLKSDVNVRMSELRSHMDSRFDAVDRRFEEMKDLWRSELHRVEAVIDARLKHLEGH
jgi:hypothetical protein